ncbi:hypothetical protein GLW08_02850 [Pontibacillus yanchengensis]|uniref:Uncharacterized protein n=2 Tax=Pontibacillus yanchengensis TaxID=462910 RepID=A0ACC7VBY0_9BACI|nr:hypothetical protein [Pontibacillus yanchengensis]MYL34742.1 hypothetical protein [Pontibacillus yanchengensis]MYL52272.1 hypothetical protein [Pontibacillus yanchengensis]
MKKVSIPMLAILLILGACQNSDNEDGNAAEKKNETTKETSNNEELNNTTSDSTSSDSLTLEKMSDFYIGDSQNSQTLIHSFIPKNASKESVVMIPGLGLSANIYESTPDNRNGWAYDFAKAGHPVYTVDTSDLSSAGLSEEEANNSLSKWDSQSIWKRWGLGSATNEPYPEGQFPAEAFDQFYAGIPMQVGSEMSKSSTSNSGGNAKIKGGQQGQSSSGNAIDQGGNAQGQAGSESGNNTGSGKGGNGQSRVNQTEVDNIIALLEKKGPSILMVHSMGGEIGYEVARQRPDLVKGIIAIEPVGSPTNEEEIKQTFADIPYLGIYGDYLESRNQTGRLQAVQTTIDLINENGGTGKVIQLTEQGINGNSHLMMIDKNNHEISSKIIEWLDESVGGAK